MKNICRRISLYIFLSGDNVLILAIVSDLSGCPPGSRWAGKTGMRGSQTITSNGLKNVFLFDHQNIFYRYEGGEREHCLELWNRDGKVCLVSKSLQNNLKLIFPFSGSEME